MKKLSTYFAAILAMVVLFQRCAKEENEAYAPEKIRFSFLLAAGDADGAKAIPEIPADASVLLSLEKQNGEIVFAQQRIKISPQGDGFITASVDLMPGNYTVTDFVIVNETSEELFAVPDREAALAEEIGQRLPFDIVVERSKSAIVEMKVVDARGRQSAKKFRPKAFVISGRNYEIFYNRRGDVDSIVATSPNLRYVYSVTYTNGRIDSVQTIDNGDVVSIHDDFVYDQQGRITSYNYYFRPDVPPDYAVPTTITYDRKGRVKTISSNSFTYDNRNNVIDGYGSTYTYDRGLNPLYYVNNLYAIMVEEPFIGEFVLSKHNFITKTTSGNTVFYNHVYDSSHRLVSKNSMLFFY